MTFAQQSTPDTPLDNAANAASIEEPSTIQTLCSLVVMELGLTPNPKLRLVDRLFASELAFRQSQPAGVTPAQLTNKINTLLTDFGLDNKSKTSPAQITTYELGLMRVYPHFLKPLRTAGGTGAELAFGPAQTLFVALNFVSLRLTNKFYQGDPDQWAATVSARRTSSSTASSTPRRFAQFRLGGTSSDRIEPPPAYKSFRSKLSGQSEDFTDVLNKFLV